MKPVIEAHIDYRGSLSRRMERHGINWRSYPASVRETFLRFRELDLSAVDRIMMDKYSVLGAEPRQPSAMLRSLLLMIKPSPLPSPFGLPRCTPRRFTRSSAVLNPMMFLG